MSHLNEVTSSTPPAASVGAGAGAASRHAKLDGVLYRFYAKTVALITSERLAPFDPPPTSTSTSSGTGVGTSSSTSPLTGAESVDEPPGSHIRSSSERSISGSSSGAGAARRPSKWFELDLAESDLFREELRLWRLPSSFVPLSVQERLEAGEQAEFPAYVPLLVVDVILDLSQLTQAHILRLKGVEFKEGTQRETQELNGVCLERWKLAFDIHGSPSAPELASVYQRCVAHFRELDTRLRGLPSSALTHRLRQAQGSSSSSVADDSLLRTGVRLSTDESEAEAVLALDRSLEGGFADVRREEFEPVQTALGSLRLSVEYRAEVQFEAGDALRVAGLGDIEVDEDYFRPAMARHAQQQTVESPAAAAASTRAAAAAPAERPKSLLSSTANKRVSALTAGRAAATALVPTLGLSSGVGSGITSTASSPGPMPPSVDALSRSPALSTSSSVFSTSVPAKPLAGLSSLRNNAPPLAGTSPVLTRTATAVGSPGAGAGAGVGVTGGMQSEAAFLAQGRRASTTSERRLRTLSSMSSERSSPPSPTTSAASPGAASRSSFSRTAGFPALRSGSFSPSSPSPLAQQLNAHRSAGDSLAAGAQPASLSSSPGFRSYMSTTPNLRSVFSSYAQPSSSAAAGSGSGFVATTSRISPRSSALSTTGLEGGRSIPTPPDEVRSGATPTVAPQMIKRYSSTFSYRQGRQYASAGSSAGGAESPGAAASGSATSEAMPYSRSWQARLEQRQNFGAAGSAGSGAFMPRSMGREEGNALTGAGAGAAFVGSFSPRMTRRRMSTLGLGGQEEEIDDLVRMIDSRVDIRRNSNDSPSVVTPLSSSSSSTAASASGGGGSAPRGMSGISAAHAAGRASPAFVELGSTSGSFARRSSTTTAAATGGAGGLGLTGAFSPGSGRGGVAAPTLSRVQVNEMLSRMAASVNRSVASVDAAAAAAAASASTSLGGGNGAGGGGAFARSPLSAPPVSISGLSRASATASTTTRSGIASSSSPTTSSTPAGPISAARPLFVRPPHAHVAAYDVLEGSSSSPAGSVGLGRGGGSVGGSASGGSGSASVSTSTHGRHHISAPHDVAGTHSSAREESEARQHRPSTGSLEMYSQSYEDEAVGRLELAETEDTQRAATDDAELALFLQRRRHGNGAAPGGGGNGHSTSDY